MLFDSLPFFQTHIFLTGLTLTPNEFFLNGNNVESILNVIKVDGLSSYCYNTDGDPGCWRSRWKLHKTSPRTKVELQLNYIKITMDNQLNTRWRKPYNCGQMGEVTSPQQD